MALIAAFLTNAQAQTWEKLGPHSSNDLKKADGPDIDYGSEKMPSPRADAVTWSDPSGVLWVFGGIGYNENAEWGIFEDLWRYDQESDTWTVIGEPNKNNGGVKSRDGQPISRRNAASWIDKQGNLWMFGGQNFSDFAHLNDLWQFNVKTKLWRSVGEKPRFNQNPNYSELNVEKTENWPGSRSNGISWVDPDGKTLWLFGGMGYDSTLAGKGSYYSDLWKFDSSSKKWTWLNGSNKVNEGSTISSKNKNVSDQTPGARCGSMSWFLEKEKALLMYGGFGYDSTSKSLGALVEMWKYDIKSGAWSLLSKPYALNDSYRLVSDSPSEDNSPGYRNSAISWQINDDEIIVYGGQNLLGPTLVDIDRHIWKYKISENKWAILPSLKEDTPISAGASFQNRKGEIFIFSGYNFSSESFQTSPTNAIWKFSL